MHTHEAARRILADVSESATESPAADTPVSELEPEQTAPSEAGDARRLTRDDLRSPKWIAAHLGIVVLAVTFVLLGRWQWDVGHKVTPLTAQQLAAWNRPRPAAAVITPDGVDGDKIGQAVQAQGSYDATHQLLVPNRELNGRVGYYVVTPLVTGPGEALAVNRGWMPADGAAPPAAPAPPTGQVTVTGWAAGSESASGSVNENGILQTTAPDTAGLGKQELGVISAAQLVNLWPYHLPNGYLSATDASSTAGGLTPIAAPLPVHGTSWDLLNIGYAFQWCLFAVITVGWYLLYWRRELRASDADLEAAYATDEPDET